MIKLRTFIPGTVMHLYWGYPQRRNYMSINNILKVVNVLNFSLFGSFGIHAKDTNFTFGTPHTHLYRYTQTHAHIQHRYRYHFHILHFLAHLAYMPKIFGILQTHTCTDTQTYVQRHWHTDTDTLRHMHVLYTYTNTHTNVHVEDLRKLLLKVYFLKSKLTKLLL